MLRCWLGLALLVAAGAARAGAAPEDAKERFHGFRVYRVLPTTQAQVDLLRGFEDFGDGVSLWQWPILNSAVDVMVSPARSSEVLDLTRSAGLKPTVYIEDVQKLVDEENPNAPFAGEFGWTAYHPIAEVYAWLDSLPEKYPTKVQTFVIGKTTLNQDIKGVKILNPGKKIVFVESGIHAREWITVAYTTYLINQLLTSTDPRIQNVAQNFEWHIFPSTNPDGYLYTHEYNRLWRKTRSPGPEGQRCNGVDPNRNWAFLFNANSGASTNPCSESYKGKEAFSEPETKALSEYLLGIKNKLLVYFDLHSHAQVLMIPYGFPNLWEDSGLYDLLMDIAENAVEELRKVHNTPYRYGQIYNTIGYNASGGSVDWVKKELGVKYIYVWELRDTGRYGFLLPASQIIPTSEETIVSMVYILERVQEEEAKTTTAVPTTTDSTSTSTSTSPKVDDSSNEDNKDIKKE